MSVSGRTMVTMGWGGSGLLGSGMLIAGPEGAWGRERGPDRGIV